MIDLDHPAVMLSGMFISLVGTGLFIYGKKQADLLVMLGGVVLCVEPFFVTSLGGLWGIAAAVVGGMVYLKRAG